MCKFIFLFLVLSLFLYSNVNRKGLKAPSNWLFFLYVLSSGCAIKDIEIDGLRDVLNGSYWFPMLIFLTFLLLFLFPFYKYDETKIEQITLPDIAILDRFSFFVIVLSFYTIIYYASTVKSIFSLTSLADARTAVYMGELYTDTGILNTIASVGGSFYVFALLLCFIYISIEGLRIRSILLLIGSFSEPIHILTCVGRDGVVFWIFTFVFLFLFFRTFINVDLRKTIVKSFVVGVVLLLIPFMAISMSRFGADSIEKYDTESSFFAYMGQGPVYAVSFMGIEDKPCDNGTYFPLFYELTGMPMPESMGMTRIGEWRSWAFSTFIISLYWQLGLLGLVCVLLFYLITMAAVTKGEKTSFSFHKIFIYLLFFQIISQGVFYFKQFTRGGNLFIVVCFLFFYTFKILEKANNVVVVKKND